MSDIGWLLFFVVAYSGVVLWTLAMTVRTRQNLEFHRIHVNGYEFKSGVSRAK